MEGVEDNQNNEVGMIVENNGPKADDREDSEELELRDFVGNLGGQHPLAADNQRIGNDRVSERRAYERAREKREEEAEKDARRYGSKPQKFERLAVPPPPQHENRWQSLGSDEHLDEEIRVRLRNLASKYKNKKANQQNVTNPNASLILGPVIADNSMSFAGDGSRMSRGSYGVRNAVRRFQNTSLAFGAMQQEQLAPEKIEEIQDMNRARFVMSVESLMKRGNLRHLLNFISTSKSPAVQGDTLFSIFGRPNDTDPEIDNIRAANFFDGTENAAESLSNYFISLGLTDLEALDRAAEQGLKQLHQSASSRDWENMNNRFLGPNTQTLIPNAAPQYYGLHNPTFGQAPVSHNVPPVWGNKYIGEQFAGIRENDPPLKVGDQFANIVNKAHDTVNDELFRKKEEFLKYKSSLVYQAFKKTEEAIKANSVGALDNSFMMTLTRRLIPLWNLDKKAKCIYPYDIKISFQNPFVTPSGTKTITMYGAPLSLGTVDGILEYGALDQTAYDNMVRALGTASTSYRLLSFPRKPEKSYEMKIGPYFGYTDTMFSPLKGTLTTGQLADLSRAPLTTPGQDLFGAQDKFPVQLSTAQEHKQEAAKAKNVETVLSGITYAKNALTRFWDFFRFGTFLLATEVINGRFSTVAFDLDGDDKTKWRMTLEGTNKALTDLIPSDYSPLDGDEDKSQRTTFLALFFGKIQTSSNDCLNKSKKNPTPAVGNIIKFNKDPNTAIEAYVVFQGLQQPLIVPKELFASKGIAVEAIPAYCKTRYDDTCRLLWEIIKDPLQDARDMIVRFTRDPKFLIQEQDLLKKWKTYISDKAYGIFAASIPLEHSMDSKMSLPRKFAAAHATLLRIAQQDLSSGYVPILNTNNKARDPYTISVYEYYLWGLNKHAIMNDHIDIPRYLRVFWGKQRKFVNTVAELKDLLENQSHKTLSNLGKSPYWQLYKCVNGGTERFVTWLEFPLNESSYGVMTDAAVQNANTKYQGLQVSFNEIAARVQGGTEAITRAEQAAQQNEQAADARTMAALKEQLTKDKELLEKISTAAQEMAVIIENRAQRNLNVRVSIKFFKNFDSYIRYLILLHWHRIFSYARKLEEESINKTRVMKFLNRDTQQINKLVTTFGSKPLDMKVTYNNQKK